jgi:TatD DNase family protein
MVAERTLIDSHCHLDPKNFEGGADPVLGRARQSGVGAFVCIGVGGLAEAQFACALAERERDVVATVGVHPHDAAQDDPELEASLRALATQERVVAIGEIGLDFHYDHAPRGTQKAVFRRYVRLARQLKKPVVVHTRNAPGETLEILESENARDVGGVIHCFSEDLAFARRALDLGFMLSFSGIVTFKRAEAIQEVARWVSADSYLVETDSPYLAPVPKRGKPNEPAFLLHTATFVAELRGQSLDQVAAETTQNALRLFGKQLVVA